MYWINTNYSFWNEFQTDATINDLLNTLECPVCLDTCESAPIYQCPEGHLLCQRCNQRLVDCPQCGHSLMNARNRVAEDLAVKLQVWFTMLFSVGLIVRVALVIIFSVSSQKLSP